MAEWSPEPGLSGGGHLLAGVLEARRMPVVRGGIEMRPCFASGAPATRSQPGTAVAADHSPTRPPVSGR